MRVVHAERIELGAGAWLEWWPRFFADGRERPTAEALAAELPLRADTFTMFGRTVPVPRLISWHGDPGCRYRYSGQTYEPAPWTPGLARVRAELAERTQLEFNAVLANYYRDGRDSVGWHADDDRVGLARRHAPLRDAPPRERRTAQLRAHGRQPAAHARHHAATLATRAAEDRGAGRAAAQPHVPGHRARRLSVKKRQISAAASRSALVRPMKRG
jgi:2-oxoglutarate-Fe(II)-dependent oxygenase superfamily protein